MMGGPDSSSDAKSSGDDEREAENVSLVGESLYWRLRRCFLGVDREVGALLLEVSGTSSGLERVVEETRAEEEGGW